MSKRQMEQKESSNKRFKKIINTKYNNEKYSDYHIILNGKMIFYLTKHSLSNFEFFDDLLKNSDNYLLMMNVYPSELELFLNYITKQQTSFYGNYRIKQLHDLSKYFRCNDFDEVILKNIKDIMKDLGILMEIFEDNMMILNKLMKIYVLNIHEIKDCKFNIDTKYIQHILDNIISNIKNRDYKYSTSNPSYVDYK